MRPKIIELANAVEKLESKLKRTANASKFAADEASGGLISSYSAAGDVEHSRNSANLSIQKYELISDLNKELLKFVKTEPPQRVEPICYIKIEAQGSTKELFLANTSAFVDGFNIISPISPIGKALMGKETGNVFLYNNGDKIVRGKILEVG